MARKLHKEKSENARTQHSSQIPPVNKADNLREEERLRREVLEDLELTQGVVGHQHAD
jgi:hypothetical protein